MSIIILHNELKKYKNDFTGNSFVDFLNNNELLKLPLIREYYHNDVEKTAKLYYWKEYDTFVVVEYFVESCDGCYRQTLCYMDQDMIIDYWLSKSYISSRENCELYLSEHHYFAD